MPEVKEESRSVFEAAELKLSVLGPLQIEVGGTSCVDLTAQKAQALLVYLGVTARAQDRQLLAGLLWSDSTERLARTSLRKALVQLRQSVGDHILADRQTVSVNRQRTIWIDAHIFERACQRLQGGVPVDPNARERCARRFISIVTSFSAIFARMTPPSLKSG
ncbi:MAG: hypothetical protein HC802_11475 [Caldilineaceae bacterium]|nr:hypothetical protein [Caldilineaceae bacterium]